MRSLLFSCLLTGVIFWLTVSVVLNFDSPTLARADYGEPCLTVSDYRLDPTQQSSEVDKYSGHAQMLAQQRPRRDRQKELEEIRDRAKRTDPGRERDCNPVLRECLNRCGSDFDCHKQCQLEYQQCSQRR